MPLLVRAAVESGGDPRMIGEIWLVGVGRNLNRAVRTCASFGAKRLILLDCDTAKLSGNLFSANGRVELIEAGEYPKTEGTLMLENWCPRPLSSVDWFSVERLVLGGETSGLPRNFAAEQSACIPQSKDAPALTVEAALAIGLYEWRRSS